ncbi:hypothetical protein FJ250_12425, partial [bacterium]|nr:hypothetical protein [bacterium]
MMTCLSQGLRLASAAVLVALVAAGTVSVSFAGTGPARADGLITLTEPPAGVEGAGRAALVALPRNATVGRSAPAGSVAAAGGADGRIMIMRGRPVLLATAPAGVGQAQVLVAHDGDWAAETPDHRLASPALEATLAGLPADKAATVSRGSYVIVYDAALAAAVGP